MEKRKVVKNYLMAVVLAGGVCTSCSQGDTSLAGGTGSIKLSVSQEEQTFVTRAVDENDDKNLAKYIVTVEKQDGETVAGPYAGNELPNSITLPIGTYTVSASCGKEMAASRDTFLCVGSSIVNLGSGEEKQVTVPCQPTCGKCVVKFDSKMSEYYDDYSVDYFTKALGTGKVSWTKDDSEPWYLLVDKEGENVKAVIRLTPKQGYVTDETTSGLTTEGTVEKVFNLKPNKAWTMNIAPNHTSTEGQLGISITIDESTNDQDVPVVIPSEWIK
ncbi:MAG: DUF4493 domain-containing protein [Bacteroidaceae bacterium]|nr:DUF4493 domain-containing protein [Bacteroidaceae bacterium]